ncbi:hypothetical protein JCM10212_006249 [Sporobolomyces blumeae]
MSTAARGGQVPARLPPRPPSVQPVDVAAVALDDILAGVPELFIKDVLRSLAPRLLAGINCTALDPRTAPSPDGPLPRTAACTFTPSPTTASPDGSPDSAPLPPTFLLALTFPAADPSHPPIRVLVPAHSLLYASTSPLFPPSATNLNPPTPSSEPESTARSETPSLRLELPIVGPIALPSLAAFAVVHTYLHTRSTPALFQSLTTTPPSTSRLPSPPPSPTLSPCSRSPRSPRSRPRPVPPRQVDGSDEAMGVIPGPTASTSTPTAGPSDAAANPARHDQGETRALLLLIENVWKTTVQLRIAEQELWDTMDRAWDTVVGRL